jgi:hypothetical protein
MHDCADVDKRKNAWLMHIDKMPMGWRIEAEILL